MIPVGSKVALSVGSLAENSSISSIRKRFTTGDLFCRDANFSAVSPLS
jgi:hypothetical protein